MDRLERSWFRREAQLSFLKLKRTEFQSWFGRIMEMVHDDKYSNIRCTQGDGALDGIIIDSGTVFQVYAPREQTESDIVSKINGDFRTAQCTMLDQGATLKRWVFVHNDEGLTKVTGPALVKLRQNNPEVIIEVWTFDRIWRELEKLTVNQLTDLFGASPSEEDVERLCFPSIREVIEYLSRTEPPVNIEISIPSPDKLDHNKLNDVNADILRFGRHRQGLVCQYFSEMPDPMTGERIAESFRQRYSDLKNSGLNPDEIFDSLFTYAGGEHFVEKAQLAAVTAILAHLFESCDIFENI